MKTLSSLLRTAPLVHPDPGWWDQLSRVKYCLRGILMFRHTREWFDILSTPQLAIIAENHPHIFSKLQRCHLDRNADLETRMESLKNHYDFVVSRLSHDTIKKIFSSSGLLLTSISLGSAGDLELRLGYFDSLSKEGEMSIALHEAQTGALLAALSFCVTNYERDGGEVFIAGLQGFTKQNQKRRIIEITRALHGMRPKALLLFALQQLAGVWNFDSIRAVSDERHVYRHYTKRKKVAMSYDEFWTESGGQLDEDGLYTIPLVLAPRDLTQMTSSKRQMYRRRYAMLQELAAQISLTVKLHTLPVDFNRTARSVRIPKPCFSLEPSEAKAECALTHDQKSSKTGALPQLTNA